MARDTKKKLAAAEQGVVSAGAPYVEAIRHLTLEVEEKSARLDHLEALAIRIQNNYRQLVSAWVATREADALICPICGFNANQPISLLSHMHGHLRA